MSLEEPQDEDDGWFDDDRWRIRSRLGQWTRGLRRRHPGSPDEPPF